MGSKRRRLALDIHLLDHAVTYDGIFKAALRFAEMRERVDDDNDDDEWGSETRYAKRGRIKLDVPLAMPKRMLVAAWLARHVPSPIATTLRAWDISSSRPPGRRISRPPAPNPAPALLAKFPQIRMSGKLRGDLLACSCVSATGRQTANINPSLGMASPSKQALMC